MSNRQCCVPGCLNSLDTNANLHKFPNPDKEKELFNKWVYSVGGDILQLGNDHIFKYRRVFELKYYCRNNRLSKDAVPTRNMPGLSVLKFHSVSGVLRPLQISEASTSKVTFLSATDSHASKVTTMARLPKTIKAVGLYKYLPIEDPESLLDVEVSLPSVNESDVLVEVKATAVNPIDAKLRAPKPNTENPPRILGVDGAGIIVSKGTKANLWNIGDEVFFTGDFRRTGSNAQYIAVDQYLVGRKPKNWTFEQAAAMPVISLTSFESLYDRLLLSEKDKDKSLLIINSAGGVGSVATQIGKNLGLKVIGTASRPETQTFTREFGADIVLNHTQDLIPQLEANGFGAGVDFILVNFDPAPYWDTLMKAIKPQGRICLIVDSSAPVDIKPLKDKSITLVSEMMFTRVKYQTEDRKRQYDLLQETTRWMEEGKLKCTLTKTLSPINAANLKKAHKQLEDKTLIGKLVLSGF